MTFFDELTSFNELLHRKLYAKNKFTKIFEFIEVKTKIVRREYIIYGNYGGKTVLYDRILRQYMLKLLTEEPKPDELVESDSKVQTSKPVYSKPEKLTKSSELPSNVSISGQENATVESQSQNELIINEKMEPLIKAIFLLDKSHFDAFEKKFSDKYSTIVKLEDNKTVRFYYDDKKYTEKRLRSLIQAYLEIFFKIENFQEISKNEIDSRFDYNKSNIYINEKSENEVEIIGSIDDVDSLAAKIREYLDEIIQVTEIIPIRSHEARLLALYDVKNQFENEYENVKIDIKRGDNYSNFEIVLKGSKKVTKKIKDEINGLLSEIKKVIINVTDSEKELICLKNDESSMFELMQKHDIKCVFEFGLSENQLYAYLNDESRINEIKKLIIENFFKTNQTKDKIDIGDLVDDAMVDIQRKEFKINLIEYRMLTVNRVEKNLKKKWPSLDVEINRKESKVSLLGEKGAVSDAEETIRNVLKNVIKEEYAYDLKGIKFVKDNQKDFVPILATSNALCVLDFDADKSCFIIYGNDSESISKCKKCIHDFLMKHNQV